MGSQCCASSAKGCEAETPEATLNKSEPAQHEAEAKTGAAAGGGEEFYQENREEEEEQEEGGEDAENLLEQAAEAAQHGRFEEALRTVQVAVSKSKRRDAAAAAGCNDRSRELLGEMQEQLQRVRAMQKCCREPTGGGWKRFANEECTYWRMWDPKSGDLKLVMQWEAPGSLQQVLGSLRDADALESLWDGASWDMQSQHAPCSTLVRWLQKDPFTGKKTEVILERVLCDCLDESSRPCWVLLERSPDVKDFQTFEGKWKTFQIPAATKGIFRTVTAESGRVLVPVAADRTQVTMALDLTLPGIIRWAVTDSLLSIAVKAIAAASSKSWKNILDRWATSTIGERMHQEAAFYESVSARIRAHLDAGPK